MSSLLAELTFLLLLDIPKVEAAKNILRTWEPDAVDPMRIFTFIKFVQYFVNKTTLPLSDMSLDHGIIMSCVSNSALPVVCPPITLVIATGYIDKLRKVTYYYFTIFLIPFETTNVNKLLTLFCFP